MYMVEYVNGSASDCDADLYNTISSAVTAAREVAEHLDWVRMFRVVDADDRTCVLHEELLEQGKQDNE